MNDEQLQDFRFRDTTRAPFTTKVSARFDRFGGEVTAYTADISMEGMFLQSDDPRPVGTLVQFELPLDDGHDVIQGLGDVVWVRVQAQSPDRPTGMGIQFRYIDSQSRDRIRRIVSNYIDQQSHGLATAAASEPTPAPEPEAEIPTLADEAEANVSEPSGEAAVAAGAAAIGVAAAGAWSSAADASPGDSASEESPDAGEPDSAVAAVPEGPGSPDAELTAAPDTSHHGELPELDLEALDEGGGSGGEAEDLAIAVEPEPSPVDADATLVHIPVPSDEEISAAAPDALSAEQGTEVPSSAVADESVAVDGASAEEVAAAAEVLEMPQGDEVDDLPIPSAEWEELLQEKPKSGPVLPILGAVGLLIALGFLFRGRVLDLIGRPPEEPTQVAQPVEAEAEPQQAQPGGEPGEPAAEDEMSPPPAAEEATPTEDASLLAEDEPAAPAPEPQRRPEPAAPAGTGELALLGVGGESDESGTTAFVRADAPIADGSVTFSRLESPPRYLVKVRGASRQPAVELVSSEVTRVRTGVHDVNGRSEVHLVFDLAAEGLVIEPSVEGQLVRIRFARP